jgi:hypothetical protein
LASDVSRYFVLCASVRGSDDVGVEVQVKEFAYKIIRKLAYCCLSLACEMLSLMMKYYDSEVVYRAVGTRYGHHVEFIVDK